MFRVFFVFAYMFAGIAVAHAKLNVFACEPEWASLVKEIGQEQVEIFTATTAFQDPHHIEARPSLIAKLRRADLLVCTGAGLEEGWLPLLLRQAANGNVLPDAPGYFAAASLVARLDVPQQVDRSMGDVHAQGNPHVHLDPRRLLQIAAALGERLGSIDPANRAVYAQQHAYFVQRMQAAIPRWEQQALPLKGRDIAVYHKDWRYLFEWLGINIALTLEPKPGIPPSAAYLAQVKEIAATRPLHMVVYAAYQSDQAARWLGREAAIPVVQLPYTVGGSGRAIDLFGLFDDTIEKLLQVQQP